MDVGVARDIAMGRLLYSCFEANPVRLACYKSQRVQSALLKKVAKGAVNDLRSSQQHRPDNYKTTGMEW